MRTECGADIEGDGRSNAGRGLAGRRAGVLSAAAALARLAKARISALAGLSAATGYILAASGVSLQAAATAGGVFLIACGSCALNQIQDRTIDSLMLRTRHRPIPAGRIGVPFALAFSLALAAAGSLALYAFGGLLPLVLALLAAAWYNGVYTYLKRYTGYAAIPGGLVGAIPPAVGWTAGGGGLLDPRILSLMVFMFIWQVPHFWLLLLNNVSDYDRAGLPSLTDVFPPRQLRRITFVWILAATVSCLMVPLLGMARPALIVVLLAGAAVWLLPFAAWHLGGSGWKEADDRRRAADPAAGMPARAGVVQLPHRPLAGLDGGAAVGAAAVYVRLNIYALLVLSVLCAGGIMNGMY